MKMFHKCIRHRCSVRGCRNTHTTVFSKSADKSNSIYLCDECIDAIYGIKSDRIKAETDTKAETPTEAVEETKAETPTKRSASAKKGETKNA